MYDLSGKVAIVTGSGGKRGFGRAIANRLAREGADIVVVDRYTVSAQDETEGWKGMTSVVAEIEALGRKAIAVTCDISKSAEVDNMVKEAVGGLSRVDIMVNNAGITSNIKVEDMSDEIWNTQLAINLTGTFFCARAAAREMIRKGEGGRIINIGSFRSKAGAPGKAAYCAAKFGVGGLTQCLALELASRNILVNAVCPSRTDTAINLDDVRKVAQRESISEHEARVNINERVAAKNPMGRIGTTEDLANAVAFLASDEASFITGQSINVNGGGFTAL
ncbi:SDR family NAD(P)-dependent oxidoreductase [Chloroflexota bacterium]